MSLKITFFYSFSFLLCFATFMVQAGSSRASQSDWPFLDESYQSVSVDDLFLLDQKTFCDHEDDRACERKAITHLNQKLWWPFLTNAMFDATAELGAPAMLILLAIELSKKRGDTAQNQNTINAVLITFITPFVYNIPGIITKFKKHLYKLIHYSKSGVLTFEDEVVRYEIELLKRTNFIPKETRKFIASILYSARTTGFLSVENKEFVRKALTLDPRLLTEDHSVQKKEADFKDFSENYFRGYNEKVQTELFLIADSYLTNLNHNRPTKDVALFIGDQGTGKTNAVKKLADYLGIKVCHVTKDQWTHFSHAIFGHDQHEGAIARCMIEANNTRILILFDDFDKSFQTDMTNLLLHLSDFNTLEVKNQFYNTLNISNVLFVFTANNDFHTEPLQFNEHPLQPLHDRILRVEFDDFPLRYKLEIFQELLTDYITSLGDGKVKLEDFSHINATELIGNKPGMRVVERAAHRLFFSTLSDKKRKPISSKECP